MQLINGLVVGCYCYCFWMFSRAVFWSSDGELKKLAGEKLWFLGWKVSELRTISSLCCLLMFGSFCVCIFFSEPSFTSSLSSAYASATSFASLDLSIVRVFSENRNSF